MNGREPAEGKFYECNKERLDFNCGGDGMHQWIDHCIYGLMDYYGTNNIYELYANLQIEIVWFPADNIILQGKDAVYYRDFQGREIVYLQEGLKVEYEKFVLSHELGHAILHTDLLQAAYSQGMMNKGKLERQAHYFAVKLLDITIDPVEHANLSSEQIAGALYVVEDCLEYAAWDHSNSGETMVLDNDNEMKAEGD